MVRIAGLEIIVVMAAIAGIRRADVVALVAGVTVIGNLRVRSSNGINGIVVKHRRRPGRFRVAGGTIRRQLSGYVIGVRRRVVIIGMTAVTSIRRVVVIAVVAGSAVIGDSRMCPVQRVKSIVNRETCRFPTCRSGMANGTIGRDIQGYVVGIGRCVEVCGMAAVAGIRRGSVVALVAGIAVRSNG